MNVVERNVCLKWCIFLLKQIETDSMKLYIKKEIELNILIKLLRIRWSLNEIKRFERD